MSHLYWQSLISTMKKRAEIILVVVMLVFALCIRFYKLDSAPYGSLIDEASYGYIAYSLALTGRDDLGNYMPLTLKAFGDYKLPLYGYVLVPLVKLMGLSNIVVRLPSAFAGVIGTMLLYVVLKQLKLSWQASLIGASLFAFSPWNIVLSRFGFESNLALCITLSSAYMLLKSLESKRRRHLVFSAVLLGLTWYTYIAYRVISIGLILICGLFLLRERRLKPIDLGWYIGVFAITVLPLLPNALSASGTARFSQIGWASNPAFIHEINEYRGYCIATWSPLICSLLSNKPLAWLLFVLKNIVASISPDFLFLSAESNLLYLAVREYGVFPLASFILYIVGVVATCTSTRRPYSSLLLVCLVLLTTVPTALVGNPQRVRLSALLPLLVYICAIGFEAIYQHVLGSFKRQGLFIVIYGTMIISGLFFTLSFIDVHVVRYTKNYDGPVRGAITYLANIPENTDVYFSSDMHNALTWYAFYTAVDPKNYQRFAKYSTPDSGNFSHPLSYANIYMQEQSLMDIYCKQKKSKRNFVFVTSDKVNIDPSLVKPPIYTYLSHDKNSSLINIHLFDFRAKIKCSP